MFNNVSRGYRRAQLCPTLCNPMDYRPPGSSVHGILQAGILESVAMCFSRGGLPGSGIKPMSPALAGRFFTTDPPGKPSVIINDKHMVL